MAEAPAALRIRRYRDQDRDAVWALHNQALDAVDAHAGNGSWDDDLHRIEETYLASGGEFLVGTGTCAAGERLVAMGALLRVNEQRAELKRMRVHPAFWRCGYGRAMLRALESRAVALGFGALALDTTARQVAAQALYRSEGWRLVRRGQFGRFILLYFQKELG